MKKLDKSKAYYLGDLNIEQRGILYDALLLEDESFSYIIKSDFVKRSSDYVFYDEHEWDWYDEEDFKRLFNLEVDNALTLFEPIVDWTPKQGDKVLWSGVKSKYEKGIFICGYKNYFIVKYIGDDYDLENGTLKYAEKIKPYEDEEIKVGDWVFLNDEKGVCKITDKHDLKEVNNSFTLLKNKKLIELLNKEL